jgi:epoxyqueuosine reductase
MPVITADQPITADLAALAQLIKDWGRELGFQQVGITDLDLGEHEQHLQRWLDAGYHGAMDYMAAHAAHGLSAGRY